MTGQILASNLTEDRDCDHDADEEFLFADDEVLPPPSPKAPPWRILIVDDEPEVHNVTRLALRDFKFRGRSAEFLSAYSGQEARELLPKTPGIALILLDVVMETDDAGLQLVRHIREVIKNHSVRIILRTGQPGAAPEEKVIVDYDINDYKSKTDLTHQKLFSCIVAALRSYNDIIALEASRNGLNKVINASEELFRLRSLQLFAISVLTQLSALIGLGPGGILSVQSNRNSRKARDGGDLDKTTLVLASSGPYEFLMGQRLSDITDLEARSAIEAALTGKCSAYTERHIVLYIQSRNDREIVIYLPTPNGEQLSDLDQSLVSIFCTKIAIGFDNLTQVDQIRSAHRATVIALAGLAESRDTDTGNHILRVARLSEDIARDLYDAGVFADELDDGFCEQIGMASILHDIGKVGVPDRVLLKPGRLDAEERTVMEQHAAGGAEVLDRAKASLDGGSYLLLGAEIARFHHEWFNGQGYPDKLAGDQIPLSARIVHVADVFDALTHRRPYKEAWPVRQALDLIGERSGTQFDPRVVSAFFRVIDCPGYLNSLPEADGGSPL